jgi:PII-like signaling protein
VNESDRFENRPLYVAIVDALRDAGFAGATVFKGIEGYGKGKTVRSSRVFEISTDLPVLVEAVEEEAKIAAILPRLQTMMTGGLMTLENLTLRRLAKDAG